MRLPIVLMARLFSLLATHAEDFDDWDTHVDLKPGEGRIVTICCHRAGRLVYGKFRIDDIAELPTERQIEVELAKRLLEALKLIREEFAKVTPAGPAER